jgi:hypothetical protein
MMRRAIEESNKTMQEERDRQALENAASKLRAKLPSINHKPKLPVVEVD